MVAIRNLIEIQKTQNQILAWYLDDKSAYLDAEGPHRPLELARHISSVYSMYSLEKNYDTRIISKSPQQFSTAIWSDCKDIEYRKRLNDFARFAKSELSQYCQHFLLHGSLATNDYSMGWSDIDTFIVIKDEVMRNPIQLNELRQKVVVAKQLMYRICPLQHHGLIFYTEADLNKYPPYFLPTEVLDSSQELVEDASPLVFREQQLDICPELTLGRLRSILKDLDKGVKTNWFCQHSYKGECLQNNFQNSNNAMYQLFWLLGNIMTMPAYLMTCLGTPCEKNTPLSMPKTTLAIALSP